MPPKICLFGIKVLTWSWETTDTGESLNLRISDRILTCNKKWILYNKPRWPAQWLDREEAPKHFPRPNLHPKKVMVPFWWSAASLIHYSKPQRNHYIWEVCSADEWNAPNPQHLQSALVNRKGPILLPQQRPTSCLTTNASKAEGTGLQSFSSSTILTWRLANWLSLL